MDPAILEAADMPMDPLNPTTFSDRPTVLPTTTNSPQVKHQKLLQGQNKKPK